MGALLDYLPIAAAAFAIPQFLPQLRKLRATDDTAGVSWSWATLTAVNNAAWFAYFAASTYWAALVPATSATLLAGALAIMLARRGRAKVRPAVLIGGWVTLLVTGGTVAGRGGLGTLLTIAFILQVTPSLWTAYRTADLTGVAAGTWLLILGELSCWTIFGLHRSDPRLLTLGVTGVTASALMLTRIRRTSRDERLRSATHKLIRTGLAGSGRTCGHCWRTDREVQRHPPELLGELAGMLHRSLPQMATCLVQGWPGWGWTNRCVARHRDNDGPAQRASRTRVDGVSDGIQVGAAGCRG